MALIDIKTKEDLVKIEKALKKQFKNEKDTEQDWYHNVKRVYKPLLDPLSEIVNETKQTRLAIKDIPHDRIKSIEYKPERTLALTSPESKSVGSIAKLFLSYAFKTGNEYDKAYGIKFDGKHAMLGEKKIEVQGDNLKIGDQIFEGTVGLWELLTKQKPEHFDERDKKNYSDVTSY